LKTISPLQWEYDNIKVEGFSVAGLGTFFSFPEWKICFDVANGPPQISRNNHFFISHCHADHVAGMHYLIAQKCLNNMAPAKFYLPEETIKDVSRILDLWEKLEGFQIQYELNPAKKNEDIHIHGDLYCRPFAATHRVPTLGYAVIEKRKKLKPEYHGLSGREIVELKHKKVQIDEIVEKPLVAYTGDTTIDFIKQNLWLRESKVLFVEVTYIDDRKTPENARKWGHTHLDDLLPYLDELSCEKIVLVHLSSRYAEADYLKQVLNKKIPEKHRPRVELFPRP
jgi:ribonuclease Z